MPARYVVKAYAAQSYYHVYNRGVAKQQIFRDDSDKAQFLKIISRHLDPTDSSVKADGVPYRKFDLQLELLCYCLMGNHFHLLIYQAEDPQAMTDFMRSVTTAYTMYFNKKYKRVGPLFQGIYKASRIGQDDYLLHISRYIHLNPRAYRTYKYSSLAQYCGHAGPVWLKPQRILAMFEGQSYLGFVEDYEGAHQELDLIKTELADQ